jgi:hypothetical protein
LLFEKSYPNKLSLVLFTFLQHQQQLQASLSMRATPLATPGTSTANTPKASASNTRTPTPTPTLNGSNVTYPKRFILNAVKNSQYILFMSEKSRVSPFLNIIFFLIK